MEKLYYKIFIKNLKWFYLFLIMGIFIALLIFDWVEVDGVSLWLRLWEG